MVLPEHFSGEKLLEYKNEHCNASRIARSFESCVIFFREFLSSILAILSNHLGQV